MKKIVIPEFGTDKELFAFLREKQDDILYQKKSQFKTADAFSFVTLPLVPLQKGLTTKSEQQDPTQIKVRAIINTTNLMDSHKDVHIDGIWNKSLKENSRIKHLQEHQMKFDKVISDKDDLKAFTKTYTWKQLGYDMEGKTQALVFDSVVKQERNDFMFKEYSSGNVDNHSVGMYYVNIKMAMNSDDPDDEKYKANWDTYIDKIANREDAERSKYFFAVLEAKAIEGSAVVSGSNPITPTLTTSKEVEVEELTAEQIKAENIKKGIQKWLTK